MEMDNEDEIFRAISSEIEKEINALNDAMASQLLKHSHIINSLSIRIHDELKDSAKNTTRSVL